jgi:hypothetical protein
LNTKTKGPLTSGTRAESHGPFGAATQVEPRLRTTASDIDAPTVNSIRATYDPKRGGFKTDVFAIDYDPNATKVATRNLEANLGVKKKADTST